MEPELLEVCVVCGQLVGQSRGFHLLHHFICNDCEREMVRTSVEDDHYRFFVERLHALWQDLSLERVTP